MTSLLADEQFGKLPSSFIPYSLAGVLISSPSFLVIFLKTQLALIAE